MVSRSLILLLSLFTYSSIASAQSWQYIAPMKHARGLHRAVILNDGRILVIGGHDGQRVLTSCEIYDPQSGVWIETGSLHIPRYNFEAVKMSDGRVFVAGGLIDEKIATTESCEIYDPATGLWQLTTSMNNKREGFMSVPLDSDRIALIGGLYGDVHQYLNTWDIYNCKTQAMIAMPPMPVMVASTQAFFVTSPRAVYLPGGYFGGQNGYPLRTSQRFNFKTNAWELLDSLILSQGDHRNSVFDSVANKIILFGGSTQTNYSYGFQCTPLIEAYDIAKNKWDSVGALSPPRWNAQPKHYNADSVIIAGAMLPDTLFRFMTAVNWFNLRTHETSVGPSLLTGRGDAETLVAQNNEQNNSCSIVRNIYVIGGHISPTTFTPSCEVLSMVQSKLSSSFPHREMVSAYYNRPAEIPLLVDVSPSLHIDSLWQYVTDITTSYAWDSTVLQYGGYQQPTGWTTTTLNTSKTSVTFSVHRIAGADTVPLNLGTATFYPLSKSHGASQIVLLNAKIKTDSKTVFLCLGSDEGHEWWINTLGEAGVDAEIRRNPIAIYPNPATTELHTFIFTNVIIFDALGRTYTVPNHDGTLDVSSIPAGVYYVSDGKQRARFVKE